MLTYLPSSKDTERYMSTPQLNPVGYRNSSVKEMYGFKQVNFALAHGSGDDNGGSSLSGPEESTADDSDRLAVHFLNTAVLLDRFTSAHVR